MLAERVSGLLPDLVLHGALEVSAVHPLAGFNLADELIIRQPDSDPHHSASVASIVGCSQRIKDPDLGDLRELRNKYFGHPSNYIRQSPALQAAKAGLTQLVISGISGTTAEVMTNNPWVGLAAGATGAAAGTVLDAGLNLAKALQARRNGRLILDVAMLFDPQRSVDN
jgi:hypothetical protein